MLLERKMVLTYCSDGLLGWVDSDSRRNGAYVGGGSVIGKWALSNKEYEAEVFGNGDGDQDAFQRGGDGAVLDDEGETVLVGDEDEGEPEHTHGGGAAVTGEGVLKSEEGGDGGNGGKEVPMVGTMEIGGF